MAGCSNDTAPVALTPSVSKFWALRLNHHAITLATTAPYDTLSIVATPVTVTGAPLLVDSATVTYTSSDPAVVVTPNGVVKANTTTQITGVFIIATMTVGGAHSVTQSVTHADTAYVNVLNKTVIPTVRHLSIQGPNNNTVPLDSAVNPFLSFSATVSDANSALITPVPVYFFVPVDQAVLLLKRDVATANLGGNGQWYAYTPGHVMVHAEATVFGTTVSDSFPLTVGYPNLVVINLDTSMATGKPTVKGFPKDTLFIGQGGSVAWVNRLNGLANDSADVEFATPTGVAALTSSISTDFSFIAFPQGGFIASLVTITPDGGGDIAPFFPEPPPAITDSTQLYLNYTYNNGRGRSFSIPGTYTYHSRFFPGTGVIRVVSNADIP